MKSGVGGALELARRRLVEAGWHIADLQVGTKRRSHAAVADADVATVPSTLEQEVRDGRVEGRVAHDPGRDSKQADKSWVTKSRVVENTEYLLVAPLGRRELR